MIHKTIGTKERLCFLVKKGEVSDIVIPADILSPIDYKRLHEMEAQGGEMMRVMRDTTLDNGLNALVTYQDLLIVVPNPRKKVVEATTTPAVSVDNTTTEVETAPKKSGRGRPKGSKNKKAD